MATPERPLLPPLPSNKDTSSQFWISREERREFLQDLLSQGLITPLSPDDRRAIKKERELARQEDVTAEAVGVLIYSKLTPKGKRSLQEVSDIKDITLFSPEDTFMAARVVLQNQEEAAIDPQLRKAFERGPSSLISNQIIKQLERAKDGKVPLGTWLLNPRAAIKTLGAKAGEAAAQAEIQRATMEVTRRMVEVGGENVRRDTLLSDVRDLEATLAPYVVPFCQERNLQVPPKNTPARMELLYWINAVMSALQVKGSEIAEKGKELVTEQVDIWAETGRNRMLAREKPGQLESRKEVNTLRQKELIEKIAHGLTSVFGTPTAATIEFLGKSFGWVVDATSRTIEKDLRVAPIFATIDFFALSQTARMLPRFLSQTSTLPGAITVIGLGMILVGLEVSVGAGISHGVIKGLSGKKEKSEEETPQEQNFSLIKY